MEERDTDIRTHSKWKRSLPEVLAVLLVLTLASMIVATGIPEVRRAYEDAVEASHAQALLTTTVDRLRSELAAAEGTVKGTDQLTDGERAEGYLLQFESDKTGFTTLVKNDAEQGLCLVETLQLSNGVDTDANAGRVEGVSDKRPVPLVSPEDAKEANGVFHVEIESIDYDADSGIFTVKSIVVKRNEDGTAVADAELAELNVRSVAAL